METDPHGQASEQFVHTYRCEMSQRPTDAKARQVAGRLRYSLRVPELHDAILMLLSYDKHCHGVNPAWQVAQAILM